MKVKRHHVAGVAALVVLIFAIGLVAGWFADHYTYPYKTKSAPPTQPGQTIPSCDSKGQASHLGMGSCLPQKTTKTSALQFENAASITRTTYGPDLSNNDPVYGDVNWSAIGARNSFAIFKVNQGTYYNDRTAPAMAYWAKRHGVTVGGYDFLDFCHGSPVSEAVFFVGLLRADGLLNRGDSSTRNVLRPTGDAEYPTGGLSCNARSWLYSWIVEVHRLTNIWPAVYTGAWWWNPHIGCWWPGYSTSWVSGYTSTAAVLARYMPCGLNHLDIHQYSDAGFNGASTSDMSYWRAGAKAFQDQSNAILIDPLAIFPKQRFRLRYGAVASEYNTMKALATNRCRFPWRRPVCQSSGYHGLLLLDREWFVVHNHVVKGKWVKINGKPRWGYTSLQPLGLRFYKLHAALNKR